MDIEKLLRKLRENRVLVFIETMHVYIAGKDNPEPPGHQADEELSLDDLFFGEGKNTSELRDERNGN